MSIVFVRVLTVVWTAIALGADPVATTRSIPTGGGEGWVARRVQAALGIQPSGADMLGPLAETMRAFAGRDEAAKQAALKALVDALLKGAEPDALAKSLKKAARLEDYIGSPSDPKWPYGSCIDRLHLKMILAARAQQEQARDPEQAARLAKAAMLLAAHEAGEPVLRVLRGKWETLLRIARLDDATRDDMMRLLEEEQTATSRYLQQTDAVLEAHDRVLDLDPSGPIPLAMVEGYVAALKAMALAATTSARRLEAVQEAWGLRKFALAHKTPAAVEAAEELLREWREKLAQDDIERAWIDDALAKTGPRPTHRRITVLKEDDPRARQLGEPIR